MNFLAGLNVLTVTDAAAQRISDIVARAGGAAIGLRVGVKKGGCAGMEYTFAVAEAVQPGDEVIETKGIKVLIEAKSVLFLFGTELDFKTDKLASTFVFRNPNEVSACGCGESVQIAPRAEASVAR
jgi:iron-sulfur cluster assembly protein